MTPASAAHARPEHLGPLHTLTISACKWESSISILNTLAFNLNICGQNSALSICDQQPFPPQLYAGSSKQ